MKKLLSILFTIFLFNTSSAQTGFEFEKSDSVNKKQSQIYSDTKMFIAEKWRSSQDVIQNDDKDNGVILVKGVTVLNSFFSLWDHRYTYRYTVKFLMRDGKYKIMVGNVNCESVVCNTTQWSLIEPSDEFPGMMKFGSNKDKYSELMRSLKNDLSGIITSYESYIKKESVKDNW